MDTKYETEGGGSGLSTGHLLFVFLVAVGVCAVFFSLGFLVGYNERSSKEEVVSERVTTPPVIPPTVIPPPSGTAIPPRETASPTAGAEPMTAAASAPVPPHAASAPPPKSSAASGASASHPAAPGREVGVGITLQVTASRTRADAEKMVKILKARGYPVFIVAPEYAHGKDNLYRVQVGPFRSADEAERVRKKLVKEGLKPFIRR